MSAPYPWQAADWTALATLAAGARLGHAYLLSGSEGLGKFAFAERFAALVLCEQPAGQAPCGNCRGCHLSAAGNHPDLKSLQLEEDKRRIAIEQVRELISFFALKPHYRQHKVALIYPAELMTTQAANALLKILEEPPSGALLLLVSHRPGQLLPTLRSRCQHRPLAAPDWDASAAWLNEALGGDAPLALDEISLAGAPLAILARIERGAGALFDSLIAALAAIAARPAGTLRAARECQDSDIRDWLDALELIIRALLLMVGGEQPRHLRLAPNSARDLQKIADKLNSKRLFFFLDQIASARIVVLRSSGVREAEIIENLFYSWARLTQAETKV